MSSYHEHKQDYIIDVGYSPVCEIFPITPPAIETGYVYYFTTRSNLLYEVRFAPKAENILGMVVNFSVISDEYDNDYPVTNKGEIYSVIATVIEIIKLFHKYHNFTTSYEFSGEYKDDEIKNNNKKPENKHMRLFTLRINHSKNKMGKDERALSIRSKLYLRYAQKVLSANWKPFVDGNKVVLKRIK